MQVSQYTTYSPLAAARPVLINGAECPSGITMEPACAQEQEGPASSDVMTLWNGGPMCQRRECGCVSVCVLRHERCPGPGAVATHGLPTVSRFCGGGVRHVGLLLMRGLDLGSCAWMLRASLAFD